MFKSLIYKEWLKTRWFMAGFLLLGMLAVSLIFVKVQHDFKFYEGQNYWNSILFQGFKYYASFKFIPLVGGVILGISQYFPETVEKRIKLSFHLPMDENKILVLMMSYGIIALTAAFLCLFALFTTLSVIFFPQEIVFGAITSILPWFLAGYAAYFLIGLIVLEPIWRYRFIYSIISGFFITFYFQDAITSAYSTISIVLAIITIALSISLIFSGYRFRKGEQ